MPPLITLKTSLKDLQYGKDQRGGGWSGLPYNRFPFPENADTKMRDYYTLNQTSLDFPSRGGVVTTDLTGLPLSFRGELDKKMIEKYMNNTPRGQMFIQKQTGLQLSNPKIQTSETVPSFKISELPGSIENTRIWNKGRNFKTQYQVAGTGLHINRAGLLPFNPNEAFYAKTMELENLLKGDEIMTTNRLLILQQMKLSGETTGPGLVGAPPKGPLIANNLGIPVYKDILFEYLGGPGSVYGLGSTTIKRYVHTDRTMLPDKMDGPGNKPMNSLTMTYDRLMKAKKSTFSSNGKSITNYGDYRLAVGPNNNIEGQKDLWGYDATLRLDQRFFSTKETNPGKVDKLNKLTHIFTSDIEDAYETKGKNQDDLIKLIFECKSNDKTSESVFLFFRAYLGQITDNNQGSYSNFRYMGRGENFYTYQGFERSINFGFKIAIGSREELDGAYERLNYLISQVYPDYSPKTKYMRSNLIKLTIGDYIYKMPGFLDSVNVTISNESTWEIDDGRQLPHSLDVAIGFKPIFEYLPERSMGNKTNMAIIAPKVIDNNNAARDAIVKMGKDAFIGNLGLSTKETDELIISDASMEEFEPDPTQQTNNTAASSNNSNTVNFPIYGENGEIVKFGTANSATDENPTISTINPGQRLLLQQLYPFAQLPQ